MAKLIPAQIRAARGLVGWPARVLADHAGVHITTVQRIERARGVLRGSTKTLEKIRRALEGAGVVFVGDDNDGHGVRLSGRHAMAVKPSDLLIRHPSIRSS